MLLAIVAVAACASLARLDAPKIHVTAVELDRLESADAYFNVTVQLENPNERDLSVDALDITIAIEGQRVAQAGLVAPVRIPARAGASATLSAHTGIDAVLRAAAAAMLRGAGAPSPMLRFTVDGEAVIAGSHYPFNRSGELGAHPEKTP